MIGHVWRMAAVGDGFNPSQYRSDFKLTDYPYQGEEGNVASH